jgi:hypothetical protein
MNDDNEMLGDIGATPRRRGRGPSARPNSRESARVEGHGQYQGRDNEVLTRTRKSGIDPFDVPKNFCPPNWEYQWCAVASLGNKEITRTMNIEFHQNGWRPVPANRHDGYFMPKGEAGPIIVRDQMLMERPKEMCEEARDEDYRNAVQQMRDRDQALMGGAANLRGVEGQGIPVRGTGDRRGTAVRMQIDPGLDVSRPSHQLAEPGE